MKRLFIIFTCCIASASWAEDVTPNHQKTSAPPEVRFELLQSPLAVRGTFKLDKYSGAVYQIVKTKDDDTVWQEMPRYSHPLDKRTDGRVSYQLFTSGLAMKFTFLMNVNTGAAWQLIETPQKDLVWTPIPSLQLQP
jgi:hypothetical protein